MPQRTGSRSPQFDRSRRQGQAERSAALPRHPELRGSVDQSLGSRLSEGPTQPVENFDPEEIGRAITKNEFRGAELPPLFSTAAKSYDAYGAEASGLRAKVVFTDSSVDPQTGVYFYLYDNPDSARASFQDANDYSLAPSGRQPIVVPDQWDRGQGASRSGLLASAFRRRSPPSWLRCKAWANGSRTVVCAWFLGKPSRTKTVFGSGICNPIAWHGLRCTKQNSRRRFWRSCGDCPIRPTHGKSNSQGDSQSGRVVIHHGKQARIFHGGGDRGSMRLHWR